MKNQGVLPEAWTDMATSGTGSAASALPEGRPAVSAIVATAIARELTGFLWAKMAA